MQYRDYYEILGRDPRRRRRGSEAGVPQAGAQIPPGRQQGKERRGEIQRGPRGLRSAARHRQARGLRPAGPGFSQWAAVSAAAGLVAAIWERRRPAILGSQRIQRFLLQPVWRIGFGCRHAGQTDSDAGHLDVTVEEAFAGTKRRVALNEHGRQRQVDVQIPAGVTEGQSLRIPGIGGRTSLIFRIRLRPHHLYEVAGKDVQIELPLAPWEAALGAKVAVPTLGGNRGVHRACRSPVGPKAQTARPADFRAVPPETRSSPSNW